ncbi:uncharacterized protein PV07_04859 [Cladophialophora immunda]|uniref:Uncharacterized protein n=1 Tax=Cladophialophora immunda TaxID=569365 RepID=A0A0D2AUW0_9EURO|nr:uncharacterized protein PV07_04859 [Cladophialophora immunda]KIW29012.1 hypothetical protein PV07_04859 [Cladophialophora immunda]
MALYQPSNNNATATAISMSLSHDDEPLERSLSSLVPTTVGRNQRRRIPMLEIDEDGIEDIQVPLIPAIGRIEDLIRYPSPPSSPPSPSTPIIRPVPDHGATPIPDFDLQDLFAPAPVRGSVIRTNEDVLWRTYNGVSGAGGAPLERLLPVIRVVPDEEDSSSTRPQRRRHPRLRSVSETPQRLEFFPPFRYSASTIRTRAATEEGRRETSLPMLGRPTLTPSQQAEDLAGLIYTFTEHIARVRLWARRNGLDGNEG